MLPKPFSDNIIFYDTEFSSLDPYKGELLSIGIVKLTGEELYLELEHEGYVSNWVKHYIWNDLKNEKVSRKDAIRKIKKFVGKGTPYAVSYVNQYDTLYMHKLFGVNKWPFYWLPIDFSAMLFAYGIDPEIIVHDAETFYSKLGIDIKKYKKHNALDDAKLLKDIYLKLNQAL